MARQLNRQWRALLGPRKVIRRKPPELPQFHVKLDAQRFRRWLKKTFYFEGMFVLAFFVLGIFSLVMATQTAVPLDDDYIGSNVGETDNERLDWQTYVYRTSVAGVYRFRVFLPTLGDSLYLLGDISLFRGDAGIVRTDDAVLVQAEWVRPTDVGFGSPYYYGGDFWPANDRTSASSTMSSDYLISHPLADLTAVEQTSSSHQAQQFDFYWRLPKFHKTTGEADPGYFLLHTDWFAENWRMRYLWIEKPIDWSIEEAYTTYTLFKGLIGDPYNPVKQAVGAGLFYEPIDAEETKWTFAEKTGGVDRKYYDVSYPDWVPSWYWDHWRGSTPAESWYPENIWGYSTELFIDGVMLPQYLAYSLQNLVGQLTDIGNYVDLVVDIVNPLGWGDLDENIASNDITDAFSLLIQLLVKFFVDGLAFAAAVVLFIMALVILLALLPLIVTILYQMLFWLQVYPPLIIVYILAPILLLDAVGIISLAEALPFLEGTPLENFGGTK